jgi:hypothetical protein
MQIEETTSDYDQKNCRKRCWPIGLAGVVGGHSRLALRRETEMIEINGTR